MGQRAVFLDRDGTVNRQVGYPNHVSRLHVYPFTAEAIRKLNDRGIPVIVVTNQSGVARGLYPESVVHETNARLEEELAGGGAKIDAIYYCPHHPTAGDAPTACDCRKPETGMADRAAREHDIDLARSFLVGDSPSDIELARRAGMRSVLVLTGYGLGEVTYRRELWESEPDCISENLNTAVDWILSRIDKENDQ
ncbi:MAG: HAD family hydrolase [Gemmatimonadetes bacterium]|nr:HAD family hydrolase [Gemmatimonadota bacterium]